MTPPKIEVNSKDIDSLGRIYLNNPCSSGDLYDQGVDLFEGQELIVHDNGWETNGIVESTKDGDYVVAIDWNKVPPQKENEEIKNATKIWHYPYREDRKNQIILTCGNNPHNDLIIKLSHQCIDKTLGNYEWSWRCGENEQCGYSSRKEAIEAAFKDITSKLSDEKHFLKARIAEITTLLGKLVIQPKIFVDFQNTDIEGRIYLNCTDTISDLCDQGVQLVNGLKLVVYNKELETEAIVEFSEAEKIWVAVINWDKLPP